MVSNTIKPILPGILPMPYDDNITLLRYSESCREALAGDEYHVLMVVDDKELYFCSSVKRPKSDFFKPEYYWIGLECTSDRRVYISKDYGKRRNYLRGITMVVRVTDTNKCCLLYC